MGYGAYMKVSNSRSAPLLLFVTDANCMYDNGDEGSNLSLFNNATVAANGSLPSSGTQYIEAKNSGSCFLATSSFTLKVEDAATQSIIGHVAFTDSGENWSADNDNTDVIDVYVNNSGDQATITVTVEATSA